MYVEPPLLEVDVFDPKVKRLANSQATSIDQVNDETSRIPISVGDVGQESKHFITSWAMSQTSGAVGPKRVDLAELLFECASVEKEQCAEGLVLG
jgi:hypothetical protein